MKSNLPIHLLYFINNQVGANERLYVPFGTIYQAYGANFNERIIAEALAVLTNIGYLEYREKSYRITESGFIFIEAYNISIGIQKEMQEELKKNLRYQWLAIFAAFLAILIVVLLK